MAAAKMESVDLLVAKLNALPTWWVDNMTDLRVMLFTNDIEVDPTTVFGDLTEAVFAGYARVAIAPGSWGLPAVVGTVVQITHDNVATFTNTGAAVDVYGYAVVDEAGDVLQWAETFDVPETVATGGSLSIQPRLKERSAEF